MNQKMKLEMKKVKMKPTNQSLEFGAELFRQGFMAVDYLEMRFFDPLVARGKKFQPTPINDALASKESNQSSDPQTSIREYLRSERGDVPGWVLVVLMTTGLVTAIWAVAAPRLNTILRNSLDSMNNIR